MTMAPRLLASLIALAVVTGAPSAGAATGAADPTSPIWPIPQEARYGEDRLLLRDAVIVVPAGDSRAQYPGRLLADLLADHFGVAVPVVNDAAPEGRMPIVVGEAASAVVARALPHPVATGPAATVPALAEGYLVHVGPTGAVVAGRDYRGALYGVSSFLQLVHSFSEADELVATHEIRFDETLARWDAGVGKTLYLTRPVVAGRLPDGRDAVLWASEWTNPRPDVPLASVTLVGSPGPSEARPILFGITGVEKPRVEDCR